MKRFSFSQPDTVQISMTEKEVVDLHALLTSAQNYHYEALKNEDLLPRAKIFHQKMKKQAMHYLSVISQNVEVYPVIPE